MQKFFIGVITGVFADPQVQATIEKLLGDIIAKQVVPLIPVAVGAAVKAAVDEVVLKVPGLGGVVDVAQATEAAVGSLNDLIPGLRIPILSDILDAWRPKSG